MKEEEDDDLGLVRASASLFADLQSSLPKLVWKSNGRAHRFIRLRDLEYVINLIEPFQSDPQLLDAHLKTLLPPIVDALLVHLRHPTASASRPDTFSLDVAASKILYTFCKVRGEKVIIGFLNNEPKYFETILSALEACTPEEDSLDAPWEVSYILLLWLSHLLLAPFDLASIADNNVPAPPVTGIDLPSSLSTSVQRVVALALKYVSTATKEQDAAAKMLVRLVTRPDMLAIHLPDRVISWALERLVPSSSTSDLHAYLGPLRFLSGIVVAADSEEVSQHIPRIYRLAQRISEDAMFAFLNASAVAGKMIIKILRNIALLSLKDATGALSGFFDTTSVLEDAIDYLLQSLADRDTPVRLAASKAISIIVVKLDPEMGYEVVQAVLDSFKEDVSHLGMEASLQSVNPLRWHGLTMALAHNLFRRSASPQQLPEILNALLLALHFEQRGATGSSIGTNVRDAACFGIWSLSRRYLTKELLKVDPLHIRKQTVHSGESVIQLLATQLLVTACFDPAGNIRRGSSAALQELVGRHPDEVKQGISLVQIVDYHAVGLRQRAMIAVARSAAVLDVNYWKALLLGLLDWRGIGSPDVPSREYAGVSLGALCATRSLEESQDILAALHDILRAPSRADLEERHGALYALSCMINESLALRKATSSHESRGRDLSTLLQLWSIFDEETAIYTAYTPRSLKAELFASIAKLITSLGNLTFDIGHLEYPTQGQMENISVIISSLLTRSEESILSALPELVQTVLRFQEGQGRQPTILSLSTSLARLTTESSKTSSHGAGHAIALGAAFQWLDIQGLSQQDAISALTNLITAATVEWRVIGLRSLQLTFTNLKARPLDYAWSIEELVHAVHVGLHDYTITERGDVGSLVRIKAIDCVKDIWALDLLEGHDSARDLLLDDVLRLSFEKLDRVRLQAAKVYQMHVGLEEYRSIADVSSYQYFYSVLNPTLQPYTPREWKALLKGCISSAGVGSEPLLHACRNALVATLLVSDLPFVVLTMTLLSETLKDLIGVEADTLPLLELLAFLLDAVPLQTILPADFKWRNLLSLVQKSHFKSSNIPKIIAAVQVYRGLAHVSWIRGEVLKKLISMLKTNPYPTVRAAVAESLWLVTNDEVLKPIDWSKHPKQNGGAVQQLQAGYVES